MYEPEQGDGPPWIRTVWHGGNNNADSDVRGRTLVVMPATAAWHHPARVRRLPDGTVEGWWMDDKRDGATWVPFASRKIPEALLTLAEQEAP